MLPVYRRGIDFGLLKVAQPSAPESQADADAGPVQSRVMSHSITGAASKLLSGSVAFFSKFGGSQAAANGSEERPPTALQSAPMQGSLAMGRYPPVPSGFLPPAGAKGLVMGGLPYPPQQKPGGGEMPGLGYLPGGLPFPYVASQGLPPPWVVSAPMSAGHKAAQAMKAKKKTKGAASVEVIHGQINKKGKKAKAKTERKGERLFWQRLQRTVCM